MVQESHSNIKIKSIYESIASRDKDTHFYDDIIYQDNSDKEADQLVPAKDPVVGEVGVYRNKRRTSI